MQIRYEMKRIIVQHNEPQTVTLILYNLELIELFSMRPFNKAGQFFIRGHELTFDRALQVTGIEAKGWCENHHSRKTRDCCVFTRDSKCP